MQTSRAWSCQSAMVFGRDVTGVHQHRQRHRLGAHQVPDGPDAVRSQALDRLGADRGAVDDIAVEREIVARLGGRAVGRPGCRLGLARGSGGHALQPLRERRPSGGGLRCSRDGCRALSSSRYRRRRGAQGHDVRAAAAAGGALLGDARDDLLARLEWKHLGHLRPAAAAWPAPPAHAARAPSGRPRTGASRPCRWRAARRTCARRDGAPPCRRCAGR